MKQTLTQTELRRVLCYNPLSGNFMWRIKPRKGIQLGSVAGTSGGNYQKIVINRGQYYNHRLAFLYMKGRWPHEIDHKDGNGMNNRWLNLRECTRSQNMANNGPRRNNKFGFKGVHQRKSGRYCAKIKIRNKQIYLGTFDTPGEAGLAYQNASKRIHGAFAK